MPNKVGKDEMSKNEDLLIVTDIYDRELGYANKMSVHKNALLHRAFSVFLYDDSRMLIQKRAAEKYHSGGLWSNACCSHPRYGELLESAVERRLLEETGIACRTCEIFSFVYFHRFSQDCAEYEFDHVFLGNYTGNYIADSSEIEELRWIGLEELTESMVKFPDLYTVWFLSAAPRVLDYINKRHVI
jgi:isopentenyl-diphosphate Delta-isomerase